MSKTGMIDIGFPIPSGDKFVGVINTLLSNDWSVNKAGNILFMVNGDYDYQLAPIVDFQKVILQLKNSIDNNFDTSIDLIWKDNITVIELFFTHSHIQIFISEEIKRVSDDSNIDFSFYLEKLSSILCDIKFDAIKLIYN